MEGPPSIQGVATAKVLAQHAKAALHDVTELGHVEQMTSPVLAKIGEAFIYAAKAHAYAAPDAIAPGSVVLHGADGSHVHVAWLPASCTLVLAFKGPKDYREYVKDWISVQPCACPLYLKGAAAGTEVHAGFQQLVTSMAKPPDGSEGLLACMRRLSGGAPPRRILVTGYCMGGAMATLAAVWAALQCPTADVRCITFGAQRVGNATFANVFRWLVGISYRCVYGRDPFPNKKALVGGLVPVHGIVYMDEESLGARDQPFFLSYNAQDHSLKRYANALRAASVRASMAEEEAAAADPAAAAQPDAYVEVAESTSVDKDESDERATFSRDSAVSSQAATGMQQAGTQGTGTAAITASDGSGPLPASAPAHSPAPSSAPTTQTASSRGTPASSGTPALSHARTSSRASGGSGGGGGLFARFLSRSSQGSLARSSTASSALASSAAAALPKAPSAITADFLASLDEVTELAETLPSCGAVLEFKPGGQTEFYCGPEVTQNLGERVLGNLAGAGEVLSTAGGAAANGVAQAASLGAASTFGAVLKPLSSGAHEPANAGAGAGPSADVPRMPEHVSDPRMVASSSGSNDGRAGSGAGSAAAVHSRSGSAGEGGSDSTTGPSVEGSERAAAEEYIQQSMAQATGTDGGGGMARERGTSGWLTRAFSLLEREDLDVDMAHLGSLEKVLVIGKLSQAVVVAMAAYQNLDNFRRLTGIPHTRYIDSKGYDAQVHVAWLEGGTAVFAFRGTESAQDGLQDAKFMRKGIDFLQAQFPGAKAHIGFMQQFASVVNPARLEDHIGVALRELSGGRTPTRVLCTGHSLGGALATLAAAWAAIEYPDADVRCITFGSPRVGNTKFKLAFHSLVATSLRVVNGADPVPSVPPALRYHHVRGAIHVRRNELVLRSRPWHVKYRPNVADHFLTRYNVGLYAHMPDGTVVPDKRVIMADTEDDKEERSASCLHFSLFRTGEPERADSKTDTVDEGERATAAGPAEQLQAAAQLPQPAAAPAESNKLASAAGAPARAPEPAEAATRCQRRAALRAAGMLEQRQMVNPLRPLLRRLGGSWGRHSAPQVVAAA